jgi:uncharacterized protein YcbK (DUF882 family)
MTKMLTTHFSEAEFACACKRPNCDAAPMKPEFLTKLEALRVAWGKPMTPTSGRRCKKHNAAEGGAKYSQHLYGNAADFYLSSPDERDRFVVLAEKMGFVGIGVGRGANCLVHIDNRRGGPARWIY